MEERRKAQETAMTWEDELLYHAKMTMAAQKNPYGSVKQVFPLAFNGFADGRTVRYLGVKDMASTPGEVVARLAEHGYALHTLDKASSGGRAVDMQLRNPVTGRPMTGSSSGTAMNVFLHFNDLGVGTDGGGSVLAPAMSLNLYGFISPLICAEQMRQFEKRSTDGISFYSSLGLMARSYEELRRGIDAVLKLPESPGSGGENTGFAGKGYRIEAGKLLDQDNQVIAGGVDPAGERRGLIDFLLRYLPDCGYLTNREGPVDVNGIGDTVFGHFDAAAKESQRQAGKGLIRVANMVRATALCVPEPELGCGQVYLCESVPEKISAMLEAAAARPAWKDELTEWYFGNLDQYLAAGAFVPSV